MAPSRFSEPPVRNEPSNAVLVGDVDQTWLGIYLSVEVDSFIKTYTKANPAKRMGGILLGYVEKHAPRPFILIKGVVEAPESLDHYYGFTFTADDWKYMKSRWQEEYPDCQLLGWFHSNPTGNLKLSGYDRFTHYRFFKQPWQVCYTINPQESTSAFYCWREEQIISAESYYLWDPKTDPCLIETCEPKKSLLSKPSFNLSGFNSLAGYFPGLVLIALLLLLFGMPFFSHGLPIVSGVYTQTKKEVALLKQSLQQAQSELSEMEIQINELKTYYSLIKPSSMYTEDEDHTQNTTDYQIYQVVKGDTLWEISTNLLGDPRAYRLIAEANSISDPNKIVPGMSLLIPTSP
jgi:proteasome lid subunit RPN8/RPN11